MGSKNRLVLGLIVIGLFTYLGVMNFKDSVAPYVSFAEAMTAERTVQVAGFPDHAKAGFDSEENAFTFTMTDEAGETLRVIYPGGKPGNFDQAQSVVVIGNCDGNVMKAKQILVKCPSKYEALGDEHPA
jgi:cytochrome c-type biogenesis protein CcmE